MASNQPNYSNEAAGGTESDSNECAGNIILITKDSIKDSFGNSSGYSNNSSYNRFEHVGEQLTRPETSRMSRLREQLIKGYQESNVLQIPLQAETYVPLYNVKDLYVKNPIEKLIITPDIPISETIDNIELMKLEQRCKLIRGASGVGKSTEMKHWIQEWCEGAGPLQRFKAVFYLDVEKMPDSEASNLGKTIIEQCLPKSGHEFAPEEIEQICEGEGGQVAVIVDTFNSYKTQVLKSNNSGGIITMLGLTAYKSTNIIVVTTPDRVHDFYSLYKRFVHLEMKGLPEESVRAYFGKIFKRPARKDFGVNLFKYFKDRDLIQELALLPVLLANICQFAKWAPDPTELGNLDTTTHLVKEMLKWIMKHPSLTRSASQHLEGSGSPSQTSSLVACDVGIESYGPQRCPSDEESSLIDHLGDVACRCCLGYCGKDEKWVGENEFPQKQLIKLACDKGLIIQSDDDRITPSHKGPAQGCTIRFTTPIVQQYLAATYFGRLIGRNDQGKALFQDGLNRIKDIPNAERLRGFLKFTCGISLEAAREIVKHVSVMVSDRKPQQSPSELDEMPQLALSMCLEFNHESQSEGALNDVLQPLISQMHWRIGNAYSLKVIRYLLQHAVPEDVDGIRLDVGGMKLYGNEQELWQSVSPLRHGNFDCSFSHEQGTDVIEIYPKRTRAGNTEFQPDPVPSKPSTISQPMSLHSLTEENSSWPNTGTRDVIPHELSEVVYSQHRQDDYMPLHSREENRIAIIEELGTADKTPDIEAGSSQRGISSGFYTQPASAREHFLSNRQISSGFGSQPVHGSGVEPCTDPSHGPTAASVTRDTSSRIIEKETPLGDGQDTDLPVRETEDTLLEASRPHDGASVEGAIQTGNTEHNEPNRQQTKIEDGERGEGMAAEAVSGREFDVADEDKATDNSLKVMEKEERPLDDGQDALKGTDPRKGETECIVMEASRPDDDAIVEAIQTGNTEHNEPTHEQRELEDGERGEGMAAEAVTGRELEVADADKATDISSRVIEKESLLDDGQDVLEDTEQRVRETEDAAEEASGPRDGASVEEEIQTGNTEHNGHTLQQTKLEDGETGEGMGTEAISAITLHVTEADKATGESKNGEGIPHLAINSEQEVKKGRQLNIEEKAVPVKSITFGEHIADGSFNTEVFRGRWNGRDVAIKKLRVEPDRSRGAKEHIETEIKVNLRLVHPNIVKLLCYAIDQPHPNSHPRYLLVMEYIEGETLEKVIFDQEVDNLRFGEEGRMSVSMKLCDAVAYIHERKCTHSDLKPNNVLIRKHDMEPLICDMGLAHIFSTVSMGQSTGGQRKGVPRFQPPEAFQTRAKASFKWDVWSLACVLCEVITGIRIWKECENDLQLICRLCNSDCGDVVPKELRGVKRDNPRMILCQCFTKDIESRPSAQQLLNVFREEEAKLRREKKENVNNQ